MPLIMMVGVPCSGKSTRAKEIAAYLEEKEE
jgi:tRNA uridine 5-carbamoylmethylation protein Kti12